MGNKMKAFLDNNQLNIDRLKGICCIVFVLCCIVCVYVLILYW